MIEFLLSYVCTDMDKTELNNCKMLSMAATLQLYVYNGIDEKDTLSGAPVGFGSGCIFNNFILSVLHGCPKKPGQIIVATASIDSTGQTLNQILNPQYMKLGKISDEGVLSDFEEVDFFYSKFDESQKYSFLVPDSSPGLFHEYERLRLSEIIEPNKDEEYFFFGLTRNKPNLKDKRIDASPRFSTCKFIQETNLKPFFYRFEMDEIFHDADDLRGCSGAPILNTEGKLVSLVVCALIPTNVLFGINLYRLNEIIKATEATT